MGFEYDGDGNRITKLSVMTQPWPENGKGKGGSGGNGGTPSGKEKAKKQQSDLMYMLLAKGGNVGGNSGGNFGGSGGGNNGENSGVMERAIRTKGTKAKVQ